MVYESIARCMFCLLTPASPPAILSFVLLYSLSLCLIQPLFLSINLRSDCCFLLLSSVSACAMLAPPSHVASDSLTHLLPPSIPSRATWRKQSL